MYEGMMVKTVQGAGIGVKPVAFSKDGVILQSRGTGKFMYQFVDTGIRESHLLLG